MKELTSIKQFKWAYTQTYSGCVTAVDLAKKVNCKVCFQSAGEWELTKKTRVSFSKIDVFQSQKLELESGRKI